MSDDLHGRRAVVIGTGIGASGIAPFMAKEGGEVTVPEKNGYPCGKAASFEREVLSTTRGCIGSPGTRRDH